MAKMARNPQGDGCDGYIGTPTPRVHVWRISREESGREALKHYIYYIYMYIIYTIYALGPSRLFGVRPANTPGFHVN